MAMTRRNYEDVAKAIREERLNWDGNNQVQLALTYLAGSLSNVFAADNNAFDRRRFLDAARVDWSAVDAKGKP